MGKSEYIVYILPIIAKDYNGMKLSKISKMAFFLMNLYLHVVFSIVLRVEFEGLQFAAKYCFLN